MKKLLLAIILLFSPTFVMAETERAILLHVNGKNYYLDDKDKLKKVLSLLQQDPCFKNLVPDDIDEVWEKLYANCNANMNKLSARNEALGGSGKSKLNDVLHKLQNKIGNVESALDICLTESADLKKQLLENRKNMLLVGTSVNLNECVAALQYNSTCNIGLLDYGSHIIDFTEVQSIDWNAGRTGDDGLYTFPVPKKQTTGVHKSDKALVFDGNILIACRKNGRYSVIDHVVFTAYSGLKNGCQSSSYSGVAGSGPTPNGVYLIRGGDRENFITDDKLNAWGKYRYPLIPAMNTETFYRDSMYLHGTSDEQKMQSSGCISLGTNIDDFVETGWIELNDYIPVYVNISK